MVPDSVRRSHHKSRQPRTRRPSVRIKHQLQHTQLAGLQLAQIAQIRGATQHPARGVQEIPRCSLDPV